MVTPLREILDRHLPAPGRDRRPRPRRAARSSCAPATGETEELRYDQLLLALGSVSRVLPIPGLEEHAIGFKTPRRRDLAAQPRDRDARGRQRDRRRAPAARSCSPTSSSAAATPGSRRSPSCRTSPPTRSRATRAPACTGCAGCWSRRPTASCPRSTPSSPTTPLRELRGRGIDIRLGTTLEEVTADVRPDLHRRDAADPHRRLDRRRRAEPEPARALGAARRARPRSGRRPPAGPGDGLGLGRRRLRRRPRPARRHLPADRPARGAPGPVAARNIAAELGVGEPQPFAYRGNAAFVNLGRYKAVGRVGGRTFRGFPAWWLARSYHMSQIPGPARKVRAVIDWTASLPFRRDLAEVGSIGHPKPLGETMEPWDSSISSSPSSSASPPR